MLHGYLESEPYWGVLNQAPWADCPAPAGGGICDLSLRDLWEEYGTVCQQRRWVHNTPNSLN